MLYIYARVSSDGQAEDGTTSIPEQIRKGHALAAMRGVSTADVADFIDPGVSGTVPLCDRPAGKEMLASAQRGDVIVAAKLDRMFRSASDALVTAKLLQDRGVDLILIDIGVDPVTANGTAKLFFGMLAVFADFERDIITERTRNGTRLKRAKQGFLGGNVPFGYRVEGKGREAKLVPDERECEIIKTVKELAATKQCRDILRYLSDKGIATRSGQPWQSIQVQRIIEMPNALHSG